MLTEICNNKGLLISIFIYTKRGESYSIVLHGDKLKEDNTSYELYNGNEYIARIYKSNRNKIIFWK